MAMNYPTGRSRDLARYFLASFVGHLVWEMLQLPLYTIWYEGTSSQIAFAIVHCTFGDLLIAASTLFVALLLVGNAWPRSRREFQRIAIIVIVLGVAYTVYSEWLNVSVRGAWSYSSWMPRLPPFGTGLSPVMQWLVVPGIAFAWLRHEVKP